MEKQGDKTLSAFCVGRNCQRLGGGKNNYFIGVCANMRR